MYVDAPIITFAFQRMYICIIRDPVYKFQYCMYVALQYACDTIYAQHYSNAQVNVRDCSVSIISSSCVFITVISLPSWSAAFPLSEDCAVECTLVRHRGGAMGISSFSLWRTWGLSSPVLKLRPLPYKNRMKLFSKFSNNNHNAVIDAVVVVARMQNIMAHVHLCLYTVAWPVQHNLLSFCGYIH